MPSASKKRVLDVLCMPLAQVELVPGQSQVGGASARQAQMFESVYRLPKSDAWEILRVGLAMLDLGVTVVLDLQEGII